MTPPTRSTRSIRLLSLLLCLGGVVMFSGCDKKPPSLFTDDLKNARFNPGTWIVTDGVLQGNGKGGILWTEKQYGNFRLDFEFRVGEEANSGIFLRCPNPGALTKNPRHHHQNALEFEIVRSGKKMKENFGPAALLTVLGPPEPVTLVPGKWHACSINAKDSEISVVLDGKQLYTCDLSKWTQPGKNPDGSPNILKPALKDLPKKGHIGFQDYVGQVEFRDIRISEI